MSETGVSLSVESRYIGAYGVGLRKNVNGVTLRVHSSGGIVKAGPTIEPDRLNTTPPRYDEPLGTAPAMSVEDIDIMVDPDWNDNGQVFAVIDDPFPATILGMVLDYEVAM